MTDHQDTNPPAAEAKPEDTDPQPKPESTDPQPKEEEKKDEPGKFPQSNIFAMFGGGPAKKREESKEDEEEGEKEKKKSGEVWRPRIRRGCTILTNAHLLCCFVGLG